MSNYLQIFYILLNFFKVNLIKKIDAYFSDLIENTSVLEAILKSLTNSLEPKSYSSSRTDIIEKKLSLFTELQFNENKIIQK